MGSFKKIANCNSKFNMKRTLLSLITVLIAMVAMAQNTQTTNLPDDQSPKSLAWQNKFDEISKRADDLAAKYAEKAQAGDKEGVEVICNDAFNDCYPINAVKFPKSLKYIGDRAFQSTFIDRMSFPDGLLGIGELAFAFMRGRAKEIVIPDSVIYIGSSAFCKMSNLKKVQIGTGLNVIESFLFVGCFELKSIILPDTITAIRDSAFDGCPIKEIAIPRNVNEIGTNPFIETKKIGCLSDNFIFEDNVLY